MILSSDATIVIEETAIYDDNDGHYTGRRKDSDCDSNWLVLRDMLYRSNIDNDDDDDDDDGSIHVNIQHTTTTIYSWAE